MLINRPLRTQLASSSSESTREQCVSPCSAAVSEANAAGGHASRESAAALACRLRAHREHGQGRCVPWLRGRRPSGVMGNVWEWVQDPYNGKLFADPEPAKTGRERVLKGGGFAADVKNAIPATHAAGPGSGFDVGF